ncbi:MAG TPA: RNA-directed DNA polymerase, partial [Terriglobales bacterium]|nr:RNA-directed DNA polymerase [Terriglobales bacterium]
SGNGYEQFRERSVELAGAHKHVLLVDVADFYNQIYLHRVNNAVEHAGVTPKGLAEDLEGFLLKLNSSISQGLPVGPAASIVLAEAVMIDVDQHVAGQGLSHCRYVDDFRIFADSENALYGILQSLTLYLYENHRLSIAHEKTRVLTTEEFLRTDINNPYEMEKAEVFELLEALGNTYGSAEDVDPSEMDKDAQSQIDDAESEIIEALEAMVTRKALDLGYARALVRQARLIQSKQVALLLLEHLPFFAPLTNNLCIFLNAITDSSNFGDIAPAIERCLPFLKTTGGLMRYWFEWYIAENFSFMTPGTRKFLSNSPSIMSKARAAVLLNDLSWVRQRKNEYFQHGPEARRAILYSVQILPEDEREHWLRNVIAGSVVPLERWVATYVLNKNESWDSSIPF